MRKRLLWMFVLAAPVIATLFIVPLLAAPQPQTAQSAIPSDVVRWGFVTAALAAGLSALGAAYAVAVVGAAAMGRWRRSRRWPGARWSSSASPKVSPSTD